MRRSDQAGRRRVLAERRGEGERDRRHRADGLCRVVAILLLDLDLIRSYARHNAPMDELLRYLVANPGTIKTNLSDGTYARLVDVPERPWRRGRTRRRSTPRSAYGTRCRRTNNRTFRLQGGPEGATVTPARGRGDVTLDARELAAIYLGGTPLTTLHHRWPAVQERTRARSAQSPPLRPHTPALP